MRTIFFKAGGVFLLFFLPIIVEAQSIKDTTGKWTKGGFVNINFSQVSLSNWAAGGNSSVSGISMLNGYANFKNQKLTWDNSLDLGYGLLRETGRAVQKTEDKIDLNSKFGHKSFHNKIYYSALMNFRTQFAPGYKSLTDRTVISNLFAPAFLTLALGLDYKPNEWFTLFLSPLTGKFTYVDDQNLANDGAFGVRKAERAADGTVTRAGAKFRHEMGASLVARFQKDIAKNMNLMSRLILFNNYSDQNIPNRKNIDVNLETLLNMKVNKYIGTSVFFNLIYDNDIVVPRFETIAGKQVQVGGSPRTQLKQVLGVGFSYKF